MIALALALAGLPRPNDQTICAIGRSALRDLATPIGNNHWDVFVAPDSDARRSPLFDRCSALAKNLPPGVRQADEDTLHRASNHGPFARGPAAAVFTVSVPVLAADGQSATVTIQYDCSGLCGGEYVQRYKRAGIGWERDGEPQGKWVS